MCVGGVGEERLRVERVGVGVGVERGGSVRSQRGREGKGHTGAWFEERGGGC